MFIRFLILCVSFLLSACAGQHQGIQKNVYACGAPAEKFSVFSSCIREKVKPSKSTHENDQYNKAIIEFLSAVDLCEHDLKKKKISQRQAYDRIIQTVETGIAKDQIANQNAAAAAVLLLGVAAVGVCAHNGGCGLGGNNYSPYQNQSLQGCCSWHRGVSHCAGGRVVCNDGTLSPSCKC